MIFSIGLSAEFVCKDHIDSLLDLVPRVNVLFGNEAEIKAFAKNLAEDDSVSVKDALERIRKLKKLHNITRIVIVTRGSSPVIVDDGLGNILNFGVPSGVKVENSVGCGDALAGAFLANYTLTNGIDSAIQAGIKAAVGMLQVEGCDTSFPKSSEKT